MDRQVGCGHPAAGDYRVGIKKFAFCELGGAGAGGRRQWWAAAVVGGGSGGRRRAAVGSGRRPGGAYFLLAPVGGIAIVPFPGLSVIVGEGLPPNRLLRVGFIPSEHDDNRSANLVVFGEEQADPVIKGTYLRRVYRAAVAGDPV